MAPQSLTPAEFKVDLQQLHDAISTVNGCTASIENDVMLVNQVFKLAEGVWHSPSGATFSNLERDFSQNMDQLVQLLHEMSRRMQSAYNQYRDTEKTNADNFHKNQH
ncbi:WXG100 family type VII secretion target [Streptomyces pinistramenti]|uniref:WXG100 family type VII secretion target n=1 Tax=Streptomyces pinistramenti TaxID=2884812 RepID=UPI001D097BE0|nr:WXG100 family type VII secretion target [Streptomyces pinistramenti]MCB5906948.1 WXG100 family type VII secretion target [Streptomyces pinistramenti]